MDDLGNFFEGIYSHTEFKELQKSALLMDKWSKIYCSCKSAGGMEEWAKDKGNPESWEDFSCDWYHGTWQYMRLLNMVAVPRWYDFYVDSLSAVLLRIPNANVMILACADYGMLQTLHDVIKGYQAKPTIFVYDICETPLKSSEWYAEGVIKSAWIV